MPEEIEGLNLDELIDTYGKIAASEFVIHKTGPIHYGGGRCGDHDAGRYPLFAALCAAPKIILSLCNIITYKDKAMDQIVKSHDIAESKLLRKVAKSGKSK
jgi:hypothetical protein